ncbi:MAG: hypothetical protein PHI90_06835, partial [Clostridia bacterium]|nr:hypothetical protein [Clostridia bacterium]
MAYLGLILLIIFILFIEFFRIKIAKYLIHISSTGLVKVNELLLQIKKRNDIDTEAKLEKEEEISKLEG